MVAVAATIGLRYGVYVIEFSTREVWNENERSIRMLAFLFIPNDIGYTCCVMNMFRWKGVAVGGGDRHGGAVFGWNLYRDSRRLRYCTGVLLEN